MNEKGIVPVVVALAIVLSMGFGVLIGNKKLRKDIAVDMGICKNVTDKQKNSIEVKPQPEHLGVQL